MSNPVSSVLSIPDIAARLLVIADIGTANTPIRRLAANLRSAAYLHLEKLSFKRNKDNTPSAGSVSLRTDQTDDELAIQGALLKAANNLSAVVEGRIDATGIRTVARALAALLPVVDSGAYFTASHYKAKYGILADKLRQARKRGRLRVEYVPNSKTPRYSFDDVAKLWPEDVEA